MLFVPITRLGYFAFSANFCMGVMPQMYFMFTIHVNAVKKERRQVNNKFCELESVQYRDAKNKGDKTGMT